MVAVLTPVPVTQSTTSLVVVTSEPGTVTVCVSVVVSVAYDVTVPYQVETYGTVLVVQTSVSEKVEVVLLLSTVLASVVVYVVSEVDSEAGCVDV